jgi:hypothetical protein
MQSRFLINLFKNMLSKNTGGDKPSIRGIFGKLYATLFGLKNFDDEFHLNKEKFFSLDFSDIIHKSFEFPPEEVISTIDVALAGIAELDPKGFSIVENIKIFRYEYNVKTSKYGYSGKVKLEPPPEGFRDKKQLIYSELSNALRELGSQLSTLKSQQEKMLSTMPGNNIAKTEPGPVLITIDDNYALRDLKKISQVELDKYQSALLIYYFREKKLIQPLTDASLARIVALLTGHSETNLRTQGFGRIHDIKDDEVKNKELATGSFYNLRKVKEALAIIIKDIDEHIRRHSK